MEKYGKCCWEDCSGKRLSKAKYLQSCDTHMRCKECSAYLGKDVFLCNRCVKGAMYHHNKEIASVMIIN